MPIYQNSSVDSDKLTLGNYTISYATAGTSAAGSWVNLGAGILNSHGYNMEKYDVQAGNAPDPIEGISKETYTLDFELIEWTGTALTGLMCGAITRSAVATKETIIGGGNVDLTPIGIKAVNTTGTYVTTIVVWKATPDAGLQFSAKSDNDSDPIMVMPMTMTAKLDSTKTAGTQLFSITRTVVA